MSDIGMVELVRAVGKELADDLGVAVVARHEQRRGTVMCRRIDGGIVAKELAHNIEVPGLAGYE
jgi:hypothetical protein